MAEESKPTGEYYCESSDVYCPVKRQLDEAEDRVRELEEFIGSIPETNCQFWWVKQSAKALLKGSDNV